MKFIRMEGEKSVKKYIEQKSRVTGEEVDQGEGGWME